MIASDGGSGTNCCSTKPGRSPSPDANTKNWFGPATSTIGIEGAHQIEYQVLLHRRGRRSGPGQISDVGGIREIDLEQLFDFCSIAEAVAVSLVDQELVVVD